MHVSDRGKGKDVQHDPEWLGPELKPADLRDAVRHQRDDHDRADQVADRARDAETKLQRHRHDDGFDREKDEGEGRVDQRGDGRADVAETGAARQQVDVDAALRRVIGDRQAAAENDHADDEDGGCCVGETVVQRDGAADRFQRQERDRADRGVGNARRRPAACALGREPQRVILKGLVRNPLVVLASDAIDALRPGHVSDPCSAVHT